MKRFVDIYKENKKKISCENFCTENKMINKKNGDDFKIKIFH